MVYCALILLTILLLLVVYSIRQIIILKENVSIFKQDIININYKIQKGWDNGCQKDRRIIQMLREEKRSVSAFKVFFPDYNRTIFVHNPEVNLLTLAAEDNIPMSNGCYGDGTCGQCTFIPIEGAENLSKKGEKEKNTLSLLGYPEEARLACLCKVKGDVAVKLLNPLIPLLV